MRLTVEKAKELLDRAKPEPLNAGWIRHSMSVGDTAAVIAEALHLDDPERARALGYVHDIGKYENPRDVRWHDVLGYEYCQYTYGYGGNVYKPRQIAISVFLYAEQY